MESEEPINWWQTGAWLFLIALALVLAFFSGGAPL